MPYIEDKTIRQALDEGTILPKNAGELNYCITRSFIKNGNVLNVQDIERCLDNFILAHKLANKPMRYQDWNDMFGALECARIEAKRRGWYPTYANKDIYSANYSVDWYYEQHIIYYYYDRYVAKYEDKKVKENGDVL